MSHVGYGDRFWNGSAAVRIRDFFGYVRPNKINVGPIDLRNQNSEVYLQHF